MFQDVKMVELNKHLVIGGGREPLGKFDSSFQLLETGYFEN